MPGATSEYHLQTRNATCYPDRIGNLHMAVFQRTDTKCENPLTSLTTLDIQALKKFQPLNMVKVFYRVFRQAESKSGLSFLGALCSFMVQTHSLSGLAAYHH